MSTISQKILFSSRLKYVALTKNKTFIYRKIKYQYQIQRQPINYEFIDLVLRDYNLIYKTMEVRAISHFCISATTYRYNKMYHRFENIWTPLEVHIGGAEQLTHKLRPHTIWEKNKYITVTEWQVLKITKKTNKQTNKQTNKTKNEKPRKKTQIVNTFNLLRSLA